VSDGKLIALDDLLRFVIVAMAGDTSTFAQLADLCSVHDAKSKGASTSLIRYARVSRETHALKDAGVTTDRATLDLHLVVLDEVVLKQSEVPAIVDGTVDAFVYWPRDAFHDRVAGTIRTVLERGHDPLLFVAGPHGRELGSAFGLEVLDVAPADLFSKKGLGHVVSMLIARRFAEAPDR
jgi:hypothetical protein